MQMVTGTFIADGNDVKIPIGFKPDFMTIINQMAAEDDVAKIEWFGELQGATKEFHTVRIMPDGTAGKMNFLYQAAGEIESLVETSTPSIVSTNLSQTGEWGVQLDASFMDDSDVIWYAAMRADKVVDHGDINA